MMPGPRGWGAAADFPGIILDDQASPVPGYLFISDRLDEDVGILTARAKRAINK
jgi:hypothetical protein